MTPKFQRQIVWIVIIASFIFLPTGLFAQEETETPTEPAITTLSPTATNSTTPTEIIMTNSPTSTATTNVLNPTEVIVSETPTSEVTVEVIEPTTDVTQTLQPETTVTVSSNNSGEITETVQASPESTEVSISAQPEPELTAVVSEPFLTSTTNDWILGSGWQLIALDGTYALQANGATEATQYALSSYGDVAVEAMIQAQQMSIELYLRQSNSGSYRLRLSPDGLVEIYKNDTVLASSTVARNSPNQWRNIRLSAIGHTLRASVDNAEVLVVTDNQPLSDGSVSFVATTSSNANSRNLLLDNIRIWIPTQNIATATSTQTSSPTPSVTTTNTATATQTSSSITNNSYRTVFYDNFSDISENSWGVQPNWDIAYGNNNRQLRVNDSSGNIPLQGASFYNVSVDLSVNFFGGEVWVSTRNDMMQGYRATLKTNGEVNLHRGSTLLANSLISNFDNQQQHTLSLFTVDSSIVVQVDDINIVSVVDTQPLSSGNIIFGHNETNQLMVNYVQVSELESELVQRRSNLPPTITVPIMSNALTTSNNLNNTSMSTTSTNPYLNSALFIRNGDIWRVDLENCTSNCPEIQITNMGDVYDVAWSPDRTQIAFVKDDPNASGTTGIPYIMPTPTSQTATAEVITYHPVHDGIAWSNDGSMIAIGSQGQIKVIEYSKCTGTVGPICGGSTVTFAITQPNLVTVAASSSQGLQNGYPAWSPDDTKIYYIFDGFNDGNPNRALNGTVLIYSSGDLIGGSIFQLIPDTIYDSRTPNVSTDGNLISIVTTDSGTNNLRIYNRSTDTVKLVNTGLSSIQSPSWSSVGEELGFYTTSNNNLYVMGSLTEGQNEFTGVLAQRTSTGLGYSQFVWGNPIVEGVTLPPTSTPTPTPSSTPTSTPSPTPNPDGSPGLLISLQQPLVFTNTAGGDREIFVAYGDTTTQLTDNSFEDWYPRISPNGQSIVFQSYRDGRWGIYTINLNGTNETLLALDATNPDWYPNSQDILYVSSTTGNAGFYRINSLNTTELNLVSDSILARNAVTPAISNNGDWVIFKYSQDLYIHDLICGTSCVPTELSLPIGIYNRVAWSQDDMQLALGRSQGPSTINLYTANVDYSTNPPQLNTVTELVDANSTVLDFNPTWVNGDQSIIFESNRDGARSLYQYDLVSSASASSSQVQQFSVQASSSGEPYPVIQQGEQGDGISVAQANTPTTGLHAVYYEGFQVLDSSILRPNTYDPSINFNSGAELNLGSDGNRFSVRWTGILIPQEPVVEVTPTATPSPTLTPTPVGTPTGIDLTINFAGINQISGIRVWVQENAVWVLKLNTWGNSGNPITSFTLQNIFYGQEIPIWIEYFQYDLNDLSSTGLNMSYTFDGNSGIVPTTWLFPVDPVAGGTTYPNTPETNFNSPSTMTFTDMASCNAGQVTLVPIYPGRSNEAEDMLAIADESGLFIHDAPLWNASRLDTIAWGNSYSVNVYWNVPNGEVWHRGVQTYPYIKPDNSFGNNDGWIAFKSPDVGGTNVYYYVIGMSETNHPCLNQNEISNTEDITFIYNREATARYAFEHSLQNNIDRPQSRVTVNRNLPNVPYAEFIYKDLQTETGTGSGVFISETIWAGGLPATVGLPDSCTSTPGPHTNPGFGWRFCLDGEDAETSPSWDFHQYITVYFTNDYTPRPNLPEGGLNNNILEPIEQGIQLNYPLITPNTENMPLRYVPGDGLNTALTISTGSFNNDNSIEILGTFARDNLSQLRQGDYLWINSARSPENCHPNVANVPCGDLHGLIIVGWFQPLECSTVMLGETTIFFESMGTTIPNNGSFVPYVADFGGAQQPVPRPFYCTRYFQDGFLNFVPHNWYFYTFLSTANDGTSSIQLSTSEISINSTWSWGD